jgi:hypothetical protein
MIKHYPYPKIKQFRDIVRQVKVGSEFIGKDENGQPIYNSNREKPTLRFKGSTKIHGTNAGIGIDNEGNLWCQSRENIVTVEKDNMGFAFFVESRKQDILRLFDFIITDNAIEDYDAIVIYGEFAGKGIQKGVAISEIEKSFFIFDVVYYCNGKARFLDIDNPNTPRLWGLEMPKDTYFVADISQIYDIEIDFNNPELSQNALVELTTKVADNCPVAQHFGVSGIGEGIVWKSWFNDERIMFKVKDERHSVSQVKKLASVDIDKLNSAKDFVEYAMTENRFNQCISTLFPDNNYSISDMPKIINWIKNDIFSEELDTMSGNNLEPKDVTKPLCDKIREMVKSNI